MTVIRTRRWRVVHPDKATLDRIAVLRHICRAVYNRTVAVMREAPATKLRKDPRHPEALWGQLARCRKEEPWLGREPLGVQRAAAAAAWEACAKHEEANAQAARRIVKATEEGKRLRRRDERRGEALRLRRRKQDRGTLGAHSAPRRLGAQRVRLCRGVEVEVRAKESGLPAQEQMVSWQPAYSSMTCAECLRAHQLVEDAKRGSQSTSRAPKDGTDTPAHGHQACALRRPSPLGHVPASHTMATTRTTRVKSWI